jgi:putative ABC transport system permease protein
MRVVMLTFYLKLACRNILKQKNISLIKVLGLILGFSSVFAIILFVQYEFSYDRFYKNNEQIYRVTEKSTSSGVTQESAITQQILVPTLRSFFQEFKEIVQFEPSFREIFVRKDETAFIEPRFAFATSNFFRVFSFEFILGDPSHALAEPNSIVISKSIARKYFGSQNPIGKMLDCDVYGVFQISGVILDVPSNSHFHFDFLAPQKPDQYKEWFIYVGYTYVLLPPEIRPGSIVNRMDDFVSKHIGPNEIKKRTFCLQPLNKIHLYSHLSGEIESNHDIKYIFLFSSIAFCILLLAVINYANLTSARLISRIREAAVFKALGADRRQLMGQILFESGLLSIIASLLALGFLELSRPRVESMLGFHINASQILHPFFLIVASGTILVTSVASGSYPAYLIQNKLTKAILRNGFQSNRINPGIRYVFLALQFAASICLMICTLSIYRQMNFVRNRNLGFDRDRILIIDSLPESIRSQFYAFKEALLQHPQITSVSSGNHPGTGGGSLYRFHGENNFQFDLRILHVDYDFIRTTGLNMIAGRDFSKTYGTDIDQSVILNETAVKELGLANPVGQPMKYFKHMGTIIGVIKDFHNRSLHDPIMPIALDLDPKWRYNLIVKFGSGNVVELKHLIETVWKRFEPHRPMQYYFIDDYIDQQYRFEQKLGNFFVLFSILSLIVSLIGLFGLSLYVAEHRIKEIGIRKVLGASVPDIFALLSKDFAFYILGANLIAWPIAWYAMNKWLQNFTYRVDLKVWPFFIAGTCALAISLLTVSWQAIRTATANPVDSLRYE